MSDGSPGLTRRQLLQGSVLLGLAAVPGLARILAAGPSPVLDASMSELRGRLVALLSDPGRVRALGRDYLADRPVALSSDELVASLVPPGMLPAEALEADDEELRAALAAMIRADLGEGRVAPADGWILSDTELRLCALTTL